MRRVVILFVVLLILAGGSLTYLFWPKIQNKMTVVAKNKKQEIQDLQRTKELLNESKTEEALSLIEKYAEEVNYNNETGREWLDLLIRASDATGNLQQLIILYDYYPKAFEGHEKAALFVANYYISNNHPKEYQELRDKWKGREARPESWFVLDADKLIIEGKRKEAVDLLNSRSFPAKNDTPRLIQLALLNVTENPKAAWDYLALAYTKDPENSEIRTYRARLLESFGKNSLAQQEYAAAINTDPKNLYLKDQLAEFYLRHKEYNSALEVWSGNLKPPSLDIIWNKALFWSKVVAPLKIDLNSLKIPEGKLSPLIEYELALKPNEFWNPAEFDKIPNGQQYLKTQQTTFWLKLLEALKQNKEKEAYDLLQFNPFANTSWNQDLEEALKRVLLYRKFGQFVPEKTQNPLDGKTASADNAGESKPIPSKDLPFYFAQLDFAAKNPESNQSGHEIPSDLKELLKGPEAFAAAFLTAGWMEAALDLHALNIIPSTYPEWYAYELTQAMRQNKGVSAALEFATLQSPTPALTLLISELLIASGSPDAALNSLNKLAKLDNEVGFRASWMMSLIEIERGQYKEAKAVIQAQPKLAKDLLGQETLARIALLEGDSDLADRLYESIEKASAEAKSYLARKAFADKDWNRAQGLTEQLLKQYPNNPLLIENLNKIVEEQNKVKNAK